MTSHSGLATFALVAFILAAVAAYRLAQLLRPRARGPERG